MPPINGNVTRPFVGVQGFLISAFAKNKDLATSFLTECINNKEASLKFFEGQPRPPARKDAYDAVKIGIPRPAGPPRSKAKRSRTSRRWVQILEAWTKAYQTIFNGGDGTKAFQDAATEIDLEDRIGQLRCRRRPVRWPVRELPGPTRRARVGGRASPPTPGTRDTDPVRPADRLQRYRAIEEDLGGRPEVMGRCRGDHRVPPRSSTSCTPPRRYIPAKYLLPGSIFLVLFAVFPVIYTVYLSFTNYGTGHLITKPQAIAQIEGNSLQAAPDATRYRADVMQTPDGTHYLFLTDPSGAYFTGESGTLEPAGPRPRCRRTRAGR